MQVFYTEHHTDLNSSALSDIWYDDIEWKLFVRFHNGAVAGYSNVPESVVEIFTTAPSVGRYYNESILGKFDGVDTKDIEFVERNLHLDPEEYVDPAKETVVQDDKGISLFSTTGVASQILDYVDAPRLWEGASSLIPQPREFEYDDDDNDSAYTLTVEVSARDEDAALSALHSGHYRVTSATRHYV